MPLLIRKGSEPLAFIHIPKTAGTSIKSMLRDDVEVSLNFEFKQELPCPPQHFHYELLDRLGMFKIAKRQVAVVRHPIRRFVSEHSYRQRVDPKFRYIGLTAFTYFATKIYEHNKYILSNHIRPQSSFIGDSTVVYRLENGLEELIRDYSEFFQPDIKQTNQKNQSNSSEKSIDPRTLDVLSDFYKKDIQTLDYTLNDLNISKEPFFIHYLSKLVGCSMYYFYRIASFKQRR